MQRWEKTKDASNVQQNKMLVTIRNIGYSIGIAYMTCTAVNSSITTSQSGTMGPFFILFVRCKYSVPFLLLSSQPNCPYAKLCRVSPATNRIFPIAYKGQRLRIARRKYSPCGTLQSVLQGYSQIFEIRFPKREGRAVIDKDSGNGGRHFGYWINRGQNLP